MSQPYQPAPKRRGPLPWILGGGAIVLLVCVVLAVIGALTNGDNDTTGAAATPTRTTAPAAKAPASADFKLTAKVTELKCYGADTCAVTWLPEVTYSGPPIQAGQTWLVTYNVSGAESGTKTGTILMTSAGAAKQNVKRNRTAGEDRKIILKVTSVDKG